MTPRNLPPEYDRPEDPDPTIEVAAAVCWDCEEVIGPTHSEDVGYDVAMNHGDHDTETIATWETKPYHEKERIVQEILGDVEVWLEAPGPNGPWRFESLSVRRRDNLILVNDVDGRRCDVVKVEDLPDGDEAAEALQERLEELHEETLEAL